MIYFPFGKKDRKVWQGRLRQMNKPSLQALFATESICSMLFLAWDALRFLLCNKKQRFLLPSKKLFPSLEGGHIKERVSQ